MSMQMGHDGNFMQRVSINHSSIMIPVDIQRSNPVANSMQMLNAVIVDKDELAVGQWTSTNGASQLRGAVKVYGDVRLLVQMSFNGLDVDAEAVVDVDEGYHTFKADLVGRYVRVVVVGEDVEKSVCSVDADLVRGGM